MTIDDIALTMVRNVGCTTAAHLISCFGSAKGVFEASEADLTGHAELKLEIAKEIVGRKSHSEAERELKLMRNAGVSAIAVTDADYPRLLKEVNDYPHVIYTMGDVSPLASHTPQVISIVGTRTGTEYGRKMCDRIVENLALALPDLVVVSGLAVGIDSFAHRAAVLCGRRTYGVLGAPLCDKGGFNQGAIVMDNRLLAEKIVSQGGGLISEYSSRMTAGRGGFSARNRIVAALSEATLVVEAPFKSGALQTAGLAIEYGREVFAVPGRVDSKDSFGCNNLIRNNVARLVQTAKDIIMDMGWDNVAVAMAHKPPVEVNVSDDARRLLELLSEGEPQSVEALAISAELSVSELMVLSFELEMEGLIRQLPGNVLKKQ